MYSVPVSASPYYLPAADGVVTAAATETIAGIYVLAGEHCGDKRLVVAGCDPAMGLLAAMVEKSAGVEVLSAGASSRLALTWLREGKVHVAGMHLEDPDTGEFNRPIVRRELGGDDFVMFTFARWEEGLVLAEGNPKGIRKVEDLAKRRDLRFVNRERGSGSRVLLDKLLYKAGLASSMVDGYDKVAHGHLAAAYRVLVGEADCCVATRSAARAFGLDFLPLKSERYDLALRKQTLALPAAEAFLDVLQRSALRRQLEQLAGYDTAKTGALVA